MASATHSRHGDVRDAVRSGGGGTTTLDTGDQLELSYTAAEAAASGQVRDYFLQVKGTYTALEPSASGGETATPVVSQAIREPLLSSPRPSPSSGSTSIQFALPERGSVSIRLYDVAGRLVRTLVDEVRESGTHEAMWDGRDEGGRRLASGVYFYRMVLGGWSSERRVVLLEP
jgi:hypothetical protein